MRFFTICLLTAATSITAACLCTAQAQNLYLERGTNGFSLGGGFVSNEDASGAEGTFGFSINGAVSLSLSVMRLSADEIDLNTTAFLPQATFLVVKPSNELPLAVSVGVGYVSTSYTNDALDALGIDISGSGALGSATLSGRFVASPTVALYPSLGVTYGEFEVNLEDRFGDEMRMRDKGTSLTLSLPFGFGLGAGHTLVLHPEVSFGNDVTTFYAGIGFVMPVVVNNDS